MTTDGTFLCDQTLGDCENLREFSGSSQVAYPKNDESYCDSLLLNFSYTVSCCQYYDEITQFEYGPKNNPPFFILHMNIRSLQKIFENFDETVCSPKPDIICVFETRVQTTPLINIGKPGYEFVFTSPLKKKSGGVGIYVTTNLHFHIIKQNWLEFEDCEDLWINVSDQNSNCNCNVIALYCLPNTNATTFLGKLEDALSDPVLINKRTCILGDFNVDITASSRSSMAQDYINLLSSKGYFPIITKPTCVADTSSTIIDHIITNVMSHRLSPMIVKTDVSDHYIVAAMVFNDTLQHKIKSTKIFQRDLTTFSSELFISDIEQFVDQYLGDLPEITKSNFNHLFNYFTDTFKRIIDKHAPF